MSAAHKQALAEGRNASATIDRYLRALATPKARGRKVSIEQLKQREAAARAQMKTGAGIARLQAAQQSRDLLVRIAQAAASNGSGNLAQLEADFIKVAKDYSAKKGFTYGAWRDAGVSARVLAKAGIERTRGPNR